MPITIPELYKKKAEGRKISMLTAYDFPFAQMADEAGMDIILVGDSLGVVVQGLDNTLPVTMEEMLYHTRMVARAAKNALVVGDMPFLSYQVSVDDGIKNAGLFLKEGASAVKLEGGASVCDLIATLSRYDIPVMAHIGLTPQSIHRMGGFKVQGKQKAEALRLLEDAQKLQEAGCFSLVLEGIPADLAAKVTETIEIPTIGIGAGPQCSGQVLVIHDVLGLLPGTSPKFVRRYAEGFQDLRDALATWAEDVRSGGFPDGRESYTLPEAVRPVLTQWHP